MPATDVPTVSLQGVVVPRSSVNPQMFHRYTRRLTVAMKTASFAGLGNTDQFSILQTGIIAGLSITFSGSVVVTLGGGTAATTQRWPYDLIRALRFTANGQSNLINVSGWKLKAREMMARGDLTDRGVSQGVLGASPGTATTQGTLSLASELWGLGSGVTAIVGAPTTYNVELNWYVPIAFDQVDLIGAIFAQTSSTDLNVAIDWAPPTDLFVLTGAATAVLTGTFVCEAVLFSIPQGPDGSIIVPDLSAFHSLIQSRTLPINGVNEIRLPGQGVGRQLMRTYFQTWNGAGQASATLANNATNYAQIGWRFGGNDTPEVWTVGRHLRYFNERTFDCDLGGPFGFVALDFSAENAFRDSIDEASATDLRILMEIPQALSLTSPITEFVQETVFAGAVGA